MPLLTNRKQTRPASGFLWATLLLICALVPGTVAWSWFVAPVYVPVGPHGFGFGQLYNTRRPPPPGRRPMGLLGNPRARTHIFRVGDGRYVVGWK